MSQEYQIDSQDVDTPWGKNKLVMGLGLCTAGALAYGMKSMGSGRDAMASNYAMRWRLLAQAATVTGMLGYFVLFQTPVKSWWSNEPITNAYAKPEEKYFDKQKV